MDAHDPTWDAAVPVELLSISPTGDRAVVAGREVFSILSVSPTAIQEARKMRSRNNLSMTSCSDVHWHPVAGVDHVLVATSTYHVCVFNIASNISRPSARGQGHGNAMVNTVRWSNDSQHLALSGGSDGFVCVWDFRTPGSGGDMRSAVGRFGRVADRGDGFQTSVSVVRFNPFTPQQCAVGFGDGVVNMFDLRQTASPAAQARAHLKSVSSIAWHPAKQGLIVSASIDGSAEILCWDGSAELIKSPLLRRVLGRGVGRVAWRDITSHLHLAESASTIEGTVQVWDINSSKIPVAVMTGHHERVTAFEWLPNDNGLLLSASQHGHVRLQSMARAVYPHSVVQSVSLAINSHNEIAAVGRALERDFNLWPYDPPPWRPQQMGLLPLEPRGIPPIELFLAYSLWKSPPEQLCRINADVALKWGRPTDSGTWQQLGILLDNYAEAQLDVRDLIIDTLEYYAERGDIVHCAAMSIVVDPLMRLSTDSDMSRRLYQWSVNIIDLLRRHQLFVQAARVARKSPFEQIKERQKRSSFMCACSVCGYIHTSSSSAACPKCGEQPSCSLCREPVGGLYIACEGCGHGGHLDHLRDWFEKHQFCPQLGCQHNCRIIGAGGGAGGAGVGGVGGGVAGGSSH